MKAATNSYYNALRDIGVKPEYIQSVAYDPALLVVAAYRALGPIRPPRACATPQ